MPKRNVLVLTSLLGSLTLTSILLLALAPAPLTPDTGLFVLERNQSIDAIFDTETQIQSSSWQYIFVHQSKTRRGNAQVLGGESGLGDHFLIGNGDGAGDGEIQMSQRWNRQQAATPNGARVANNCLTICVVGDLDQAGPTSAQLRRLEELVRTLQHRFGITGKDVIAYDRPNEAAGIGAKFPVQQFASHLLP